MKCWKRGVLGRFDPELLHSALKADYKWFAVRERVGVSTCTVPTAKADLTGRASPGYHFDEDGSQLALHASGPML